ncbi:MAG: porin [Fluviicola sp.]|nr:MAG: porin [Fluviicola sp.]
MRFILTILFACLTSIFTNAQFGDYSFGEGFRYKAKDTTFSIKAAFRFQLLSRSDWDVRNDDVGDIGGLETNFLVHRARLKFNGFAFSPRLEYKFELGLTNCDINNPNASYFGGGSNVVLDAFVDWNFYGGFTLRAGQTKLPGNRERVLSSANMQFVNRSVLNSKFNLDRDVGLSLSYAKTLGKQFGVEIIGAFSQGEGRNIIAGNQGGYQYTVRAEFLPLGKFHKKGDYVGSAMYREEKPKLSIGVSVDQNTNAARSRGNLGDFLPADARFKSLQSIFVDFMFKYSGFSMMGEYVIRDTDDRNSFYLDESGQNIAGYYYTGAALNLQAGWMFKNNVEIAGRYARLAPTHDLIGVDENHYFLALSKFIVGHKLKIQTDVGYMQKDVVDDGLMWRVQFDLHL